jgi:hypothetical protein
LGEIGELFAVVTLDRFLSLLRALGTIVGAPIALVILLPGPFIFRRRSDHDNVIVVIFFWSCSGV